MLPCSGFIGTEEFKDGIKSIMPLVNDVELKDMITQFDGNGDGQISFKEFAEACMVLSRAKP